MRARSVKSFDDSTSSDDGASESGGEDETSDSDLDLDGFDGVVEPGWLAAGLEILGKFIF